MLMTPRSMLDITVSS
uniref:Uncharacterized protein n=1 Tax=Anguilla anguilla TaxID=7936 RepID=A0A0E9RGC7_ANGAN